MPKKLLSFRSAIPILLILLLISGLLICKEKIQSKDVQIAQQSQQTNAADDKDHIAVLSLTDIQEQPILSANEISIVDSLLQKAVDKFNKENHTSRADQFINLSKYKRQYIVSCDKVKGKMIYVNCLCEVSGNDWKKKEILVRDGGRCYFNLMINLKLRKYFRFLVNGLA